MTPEDREVLEDVLVNVDDWLKHARVYAVKQWDTDSVHLARLTLEASAAADNPFEARLVRRVHELQEKVAAGPDRYLEWFVASKVARHQEQAKAARAKPGYKNRAQREEDERARITAAQEEAARVAALAEEEKKAQFKAAVDAAVTETLKQRGVS